MCGLAGIVAIHTKEIADVYPDIDALDAMITRIEENGCAEYRKTGDSLGNEGQMCSDYLGGADHIDALCETVVSLKSDLLFYKVFHHREYQAKLTQLADRITKIIETEESVLPQIMGRLNSETVTTISQRIEMLKDSAWRINWEILDNCTKINELIGYANLAPTFELIKIYRHINAVLNSIDRLEVRGRDSAGISLLFVLDESEFEFVMAALADNQQEEQLDARRNQPILMNNCVNFRKVEDQEGAACISVSLVYKVANAVGSLGDNIRFLRNQIKTDPLLGLLASSAYRYFTVSAHTRWASVGAITEPNCHPVDSITRQSTSDEPIIHVCLNGDIDNYIELKADYEADFEIEGGLIDKAITTDTKIIPLQIKKYLNSGVDIEEAFRQAVNAFKGSHAISMQTDLAPGKIFLAQKGSGQAIFIGLAPDHYMPASEVYGFVEETSRYLKMDGEKIFQGPQGPVQGQIFILDQKGGGDLTGIKTFYYDSTPIELSESDIKLTDITSRDIDRQGYAHYFLKEISEAPESVAKTLENSWKVKLDEKDRYLVTLDKTTFPDSICDALQEDATVTKIRRIFFIGQGTAGVAALACANIFDYYMNDPGIQVSALKASEMSGFKLGDDEQSMADALVIAISQSGTTTDTNRTVDMVKQRGAHTLAIVNRRDSDITFKADGVMYTSSGRDIEMSVASTKAFYSQIVAGALLGLNMAQLTGRRGVQFITDEIRELLSLPDKMRRILAIQGQIKRSAHRLAADKTYWAVVGSGPNKASSDEIRIKLSELCYKTLSSDFVEDKKHIDLSAEPLIMVCAAGARETVIGDIIKDTAIFHAHKATPIVIVDEGEKRFDPYAADIFHVPAVSEHLAPIVNTLAGHIWGYYAALSINSGSQLLYRFQEDIRRMVDEYSASGMNIYEVILEEAFREKIVRFYNEFRSIKSEQRFPVNIAKASDLTLLLKYLSGKLPMTDFEFDFGKKGTALNMLDTLFECTGEAINRMLRPVDAIKHQAKTVTVGTSRIISKMEGILFDSLDACDISIAQMTNRNILVVQNLQRIIAQIRGSILYRVAGLNLLGETTEQTIIHIMNKEGTLKPLTSRVEGDSKLKGTKKIIVRSGNVFIGIGRKDDRSIIIVPIFSASPKTPNIIEYILLHHIDFKDNIALADKISALGGKYEHITNIVQETGVQWRDEHLNLIDVRELFGRSAEKVAELIVARVSAPSHQR
ncbi:SIS domain-containing protein [Desulfococcaceae bacterium HSG7]|nr:SIS domain-containing protein [Desulfococcaceae bacterium HSG7]